MTRFARGGSLAALLLLLSACAGGSKAPSVGLFHRLVPAASFPRFKWVATLNWSNPIDLVGQGIPLPEPTYPSAAVKEFQDVHLQAATGDVLRQGDGLQATDVVLGVAEFASASDAKKAKIWMHMQDVQQPCFGTCIFSPRPVKLAGIPESVAVVQKLVKARPPDPANYRAEFTIGKYLYWTWFTGDSRSKTEREFVAGIANYYRHATHESS